MRRGAGIVFGVGLALAVSGTATAGATSVPRLAPTVTNSQACGVVFGADTMPAAPSQGDVAPGDHVPLAVVWPAGWSSPTVEVLACTLVDGRYVDGLSAVVRRAENTGRFVHEVTVPDGIAPGTRLCQRAAAIGLAKPQQATIQRIDAACFTVRAAAAPPAPVPTPPLVVAAAPVEAQAPATPGEAPAPIAPALETRTAASVVETPAPAAPHAAPPAALPRTGATERRATAGAGLLLALGGAGVALGQSRKRSRAAGIQSR